MIRYAGFVGIDWKQTATVCAQHVASPIRTIQLISNLSPKTSELIKTREVEVDLK